MKKLITSMALIIVALSLYATEFNSMEWYVDSVGKANTTGTLVSEGYIYIANKITETSSGWETTGQSGIPAAYETHDNYTAVYTKVSGYFDFFIEIAKMPERDEYNYSATTERWTVPEVALLFSDKLDSGERYIGVKAHTGKDENPDEDEDTNQPYAKFIERTAVGADTATAEADSTSLGNYSGKHIYLRIKRDADGVTCYRAVGASNANIYSLSWQSVGDSDENWALSMSDEYYLIIGNSLGLRSSTVDTPGDFNGVSSRISRFGSSAEIEVNVDNSKVTTSANGMLPFEVEVSGLYFGMDSGDLAYAYMSNTSAGVPPITISTVKRLSATRASFTIPSTEYFVEGEHIVILEDKWGGRGESTNTIYLSMSNVPAVSGFSLSSGSLPAKASDSISIELNYNIPMDVRETPVIALSNEGSGETTAAIPLSSGTWEDSQTFSTELSLTSYSLSSGRYALIIQTNGLLDKWDRYLSSPTILYNALPVDTDDELDETANFIPPVIKYNSAAFSSRLTVNVTESSSDVDITIVDFRGKEVKHLYSGTRSQGTFTVEWDGMDNNGSELKPGNYIAKVEIDGKQKLAPITIIY